MNWKLRGKTRLLKTSNWQQHCLKKINKNAAPLFIWMRWLLVQSRCKGRGLCQKKTQSHPAKKWNLFQPLPQYNVMSSGEALHLPITYVQVQNLGRWLHVNATVYLAIIATKDKMIASVITFQSNRIPLQTLIQQHAPINAAPCICLDVLTECLSKHKIYRIEKRNSDTGKN